jgi:hypothetical protein
MKTSKPQAFAGETQSKSDRKRVRKSRKAILFCPNIRFVSSAAERRVI